MRLVLEPEAIKTLLVFYDFSFSIASADELKKRLMM